MRSATNSGRGQDLHPIPVAVEGVEPEVAREGLALAGVDVVPEAGQSVREGVELLDGLHEQRRVRLAGRGERVLHADMDLRPARVAHPQSAAGLEVVRLLDLGHAEPLDVEAAGDLLAADR